MNDPTYALCPRLSEQQETEGVAVPYNLDIPGQVDELQLRAIEHVARLIPDGGTVVEVGSLFGRSSWAWAKSAPKATVYCIDPWTRNSGVRSMEEQFGIKYGIETFAEFTKDCPNIRPMKGYSPQDFVRWDQPVDLYYEDAVHVDPIFSENLEFWMSRLRSNGVVCGDDFRPRFPDVVSGAQRSATALGRELLRVGYFWCLLPSHDPHGDVARVRTALGALGVESISLRSGEAFRYDAVCDVVPGSQHSGGISLKVRVTNLSPDVWPQPQRYGEASLIIEGRPVVAGRVGDQSWSFWLAASLLIPDQHLEQHVRLDLPGEAQGEWRFECHLQLGDVLQRQERRIGDACTVVLRRPKTPTLSDHTAVSAYLGEVCTDALASGGEICESGLSQLADKVFEVAGVSDQMRSMLEPRELALLHILARDFYSGQGYVIDAGCLFGASTCALASGIRVSRTPITLDRPIQSFDLFDVSGPYLDFVKGFRAQGPTSSGLDDFIKFTQPYRDLVSVHQGDFKTFEWSGDPVEIIFNDLSKSVALNDFMVRTYFSCLMPGKSLVVQQDYVHFAEWWIAATMEHFRASFTELGYFYGATKLFLYHGTDPAEFSQFSLRDFSFEQLEALLQSAIRRAPVTVAEALITALGMFYIDYDCPEKALATVLPLGLDQAKMSLLLAADVPTGENFALPLPSYRRRVIRYAQDGYKTPEL